MSTYRVKPTVRALPALPPPPVSTSHIKMRALPSPRNGYRDTVESCYCAELVWGGDEVSLCHYAPWDEYLSSLSPPPQPRCHPPALSNHNSASQTSQSADERFEMIGPVTRCYGLKWRRNRRCSVWHLICVCVHGYVRCVPFCNSQLIKDVYSNVRTCLGSEAVLDAPHFFVWG